MLLPTFHASLNCNAKVFFKIGLTSIACGP